MAIKQHPLLEEKAAADAAAASAPDSPDADLATGAASAPVVDATESTAAPEAPAPGPIEEDHWKIPKSEAGRVFRELVGGDPKLQHVFESEAGRWAQNKTRALREELDLLKAERAAERAAAVKQRIDAMTPDQRAKAYYENPQFREQVDAVRDFDPAFAREATATISEADKIVGDVEETFGTENAGKFQQMIDKGGCACGARDHGQFDQEFDFRTGQHAPNAAPLPPSRALLQMQRWVHWQKDQQREAKSSASAPAAPATAPAPPPSVPSPAQRATAQAPAAPAPKANPALAIRPDDSAPSAGGRSGGSLTLSAYSNQKPPDQVATLKRLGVATPREAIKLGLIDPDA